MLDLSDRYVPRIACKTHKDNGCGEVLRPRGPLTICPGPSASLHISFPSTNQHIPSGRSPRLCLPGDPPYSSLTHAPSERAGRYGHARIENNARPRHRDAFMITLFLPLLIFSSLLVLSSWVVPSCHSFLLVIRFSLLFVLLIRHSPSRPPGSHMSFLTYARRSAGKASPWGFWPSGQRSAWSWISAT